MLRKLISQYQPQHMAVVFDSKGKPRDALYENTKRMSKMPDELIQQIEPIHAIIKALDYSLMVTGLK